MYLKRPDGPRVVTLPDGSSMTRADLPPPQTKRWVASRKAKVVRAVCSGLIQRKEACALYGLSDEELQSWCEAVADHGVPALKATALQRFRQSVPRSEGQDTGN